MHSSQTINQLLVYYPEKKSSNVEIKTYSLDNKTTKSMSDANLYTKKLGQKRFLES